MRTAPPRLLERVVAASLAPEERAAVLGDLHEEFAGLESRVGRRAAISWYARQAVRSLGPNLIRRISIARRRPRTESEAGRSKWRSVLFYGLELGAFGAAPILTSLWFPGVASLDVVLWAVPLMGLGLGWLHSILVPGSIGEQSQTRLLTRAFWIFCLPSRLPFIFLHSEFPRFVRACDVASFVVLMALFYWARSRSATSH